MPKKKKLSPKPSKDAGFSLIELLLAFTILSIILSMAYTILISTIKARDRVHAITDSDRAASRLLTIISRDIQHTYMYQLEGTYFMGKSSREESRLDLVTSTDSLFFMQDIRSDLCEVSYWVRPNPQEAGTLQLLRREDFYLDADLDKGGYATRLFDRLTSFQLRFYDSQGGIATSWDSDKKKGLPIAVEIMLGLTLSPPGTPAETLAKNAITYRVLAPILVSPKPPVPKKELEEKE